MRTPARRMALAALSALAATAAFAPPAGATVFEHGISVHEDAYVQEDGGVILSGTYHCEQASPMGAMQIKATVDQGDGRLSIGAEEVVCDGTERRWVAHAPGAFSHVHPGRATVTAELQEIRLSGLMPTSVATVAQDTEDVTVHEDR
ncbi:DUF6299 family protein [Streptomyces sp. NPDC091268]|uniref:DUF6299 family protein n=1 Tax=Streptomyces sp. NPDC091268 TaxID=3365979 RepID=UPI003812C115